MLAAPPNIALCDSRRGSRSEGLPSQEQTLVIKINGFNTGEHLSTLHLKSLHSSYVEAQGKKPPIQPQLILVPNRHCLVT